MNIKVNVLKINYLFDKILNEVTIYYIMTRLNEIMKKICLMVISPDNFEHELFIKIESL